MKNKKLMSLFLAIAMLFAMAVPAFASGNDPKSKDQTTTLTGAPKGYDLDLTVGNTGKVIVNPYKISFTPTAAEAGRAFDEATDDQIINPGTFITNNTPIPLKVNAKITATKGDNVSLLDAVNKVNTESETNSNVSVNSGKFVPKAAFVTFEIAKCDDAETEPDWKEAKAITDTATADGTTKEKTATILKQLFDTTDTTKQVPQVLTECLKFDAVGEEDDPSYACFHLSGYLNVYPQKAKSDNSAFEDDPWVAADVVGATVVLTFLPDVEAKPIT